MWSVKPYILSFVSPTWMTCVAGCFSRSDFRSLTLVLSETVSSVSWLTTSSKRSRLTTPFRSEILCWTCNDANSFFVPFFLQIAHFYTEKTWLTFYFSMNLPVGPWLWVWGWVILLVDWPLIWAGTFLDRCRPGARLFGNVIRPQPYGYCCCHPETAAAGSSIYCHRKTFTKFRFPY